MQSRGQIFGPQSATLPPSAPLPLSPSSLPLSLVGLTTVILFEICAEFASAALRVGTRGVLRGGDEAEVDEVEDGPGVVVVVGTGS